LVASQLTSLRGAAIVRPIDKWSISPTRSNTMTSRLFFVTIALTLSAVAAPSFAQDCATVEVHNVRPSQGFLMVAAYVDADSYNKKPLVSKRVAAGDAITSFELCGLTGNTVALTMFQDLDSDGKMGKNLVGMPTEPWGSSGNPGMFGPTWETGKVTRDGTKIVVKMSQ
jgi:uncharacterized protein (DUF2141 family)